MEEEQQSIAHKSNLRIKRRSGLIEPENREMEPEKVGREE